MRPLWELDPKSLPGPLAKIFGKEMHLWVGGWLADRAKRIARPAPDGVRHVLFAVCDHYEPLHGNATHERGVERVRAWRELYPKVLAPFRDSNGRPPQHSFFYPGEQYHPDLVEPVAELVEQGFGDFEVHLHHDGDTRATLRASLEKTLEDLGRHGVISKKDGRPAWAFIHGNWCLANARRDGRWCGVDDEMLLLHELGCYADFTFPSAPDQCQPAIVNSIYYPTGDLAKRRAYEHGEPVRVGSARQDRLLMIEGPLALAARPSKSGAPRRIPKIRIESAAIDHSDPPTSARLATWIEQDIHVAGRPEWTFVKVHTHGAPEGNAAVLLGEAARTFHEALAAYNDRVRYRLHYVTAREMYNVARAAMDGLDGDPSNHFDYEIPPPPRRPTRDHFR
ncbi:MAG: hypothetical protein U0169_02565 [Polyangiaceae bacterium]